MKLLIILSTLLSSDVFSAGDSAHHAGPMDLIPAFVNFTILFFVLFKLLKKPVSEFFKNKHDEIKGLVEAASIKASEAQKMLEEQKRKSSNLDNELKEIEQDSDKFIKTFQSEYHLEVKERIVRLKEDTKSKVEAERRAGMNDLNEQLLDAVVAEAKCTIRNDKALNQEASNKILEGIR